MRVVGGELSEWVCGREKCDMSGVRWWEVGW